MQKDLKPALRELGFQIKDIPKKLYKYAACDEKDRKQKLSDIKSKKVWLSYAEFLNDPFEGLALYVDKERLEAHGWHHDNIHTLYRTLKSLGDDMLIGSFAASGLKEDMPLWAHYAYDHKGYCLEYEVTNDKYIYPVLYEDKRYLAAKTLSDFVLDAEKLNTSEESEERFLVIWASFMIKHTVWQYEKEFRILKYAYNKNKEEGCLGQCLQEKDLGIKLKAVYIGEKCTYKEDLLELGKERACLVYQMRLNPYEENFNLEAKSVYPF